MAQLRDAANWVLNTLSSPDYAAIVTTNQKTTQSFLQMTNKNKGTVRTFIKSVRAGMAHLRPISGPFAARYRHLLFHMCSSEHLSIPPCVVFPSKTSHFFANGGKLKTGAEPGPNYLNQTLSRTQQNALSSG